MLIKVVAFQGHMGEKLTLEEKIYIFKQRPDFICLPEYYMLDDTVDDYYRAALNKNEYLQYLSGLSDELSTCLIAGTVVEPNGNKLYNTSYVINRGRVIGRSDPDVQHAVDRREEAQPGPVRAQPGCRLVGISKQDLPRNQSRRGYVSY